MAQNTELPTFVNEYLAKYKDSYFGYVMTAAHVENACRSALSSSGILANVTSRAKDADRLKTKLQKMHKDEKPFTNTEDIVNRLVDLIGVRVTLYFPSQVEETITRLRTLYSGAALDEKSNSDERPLSANELLAKFSQDKTMARLSEKPTETHNQVGLYQPQYGGYRAIHIRFKMENYDLGTKVQAVLKNQPLKVEVQIQSLLMHSWSEVNHDLAYKTLSGQLSTEEVHLLDCLNGVGKLGEHVLLRLKQTLDLRLRQPTTNFQSAFELSQYIRQYVDNLNKSNPPKPYVLGDVDDLLDFLVSVNQNNPETMGLRLREVRNFFDMESPIVNSLFSTLESIWFSFGFSVQTPFLVKSQNDRIQAGPEKNKYEVLATILDMACRAILQTRPESFGILVFPLSYMDLLDLKLYLNAEPVMPKTAFPVDRAVLDKTDVRAKLDKLVAFFNKNASKNMLVQNSLRMAQIRTWKMYENKDFTRPFNF